MNVQDMKVAIKLIPKATEYSSENDAFCRFGPQKFETNLLFTGPVLGNSKDTSDVFLAVDACENDMKCGHDMGPMA